MITKGMFTLMHINDIGPHHFKLTNSHSLHTLVTEREFNYGICKLYCVGMWFELKIHASRMQ